MYDLIYAAREAQIRFKRLRKCVRRGDEDTGHWTEDECNEKTEHYRSIEMDLRQKWQDAYGEAW